MADSFYSALKAHQQEAEALRQLPLEELKARFLKLTGVPLPKFMRRGLMAQAVAHAAREAAGDRLDRESRRQLDILVRQIVPKGEVAPSRSQVRRIKAGTRLLREWQGRVHEVFVVKDGFTWQGSTYRSLSEIARRITGTRWNGWVFFGLKKTGAGASQSTSVRARRKQVRPVPASSAPTPRALEAGNA